MGNAAFGPVAVALTTAAQGVLPTGWTASLGYLISDGTGPLVMIGGEDPDDPDESPLGSLAQDWHGTGSGAERDEEGDITCSARSWNGDGDLVAAVNDVQSALDAIAGACGSNKSLGVSQVLWTSFGTQVSWFQSSGEDGIKVRAVFTIHYRALV